MTALDRFHPIVRQWFGQLVGTPTDIQTRAWPEIAGGNHVLVTAPTGSGKTLTAFLWAINNLILNAGAKSMHRVLYISPLKALNNDIERNLTVPLGQLKECFERAGEAFPGIRIAVRSGDTDPSQRRQIVRHPPEIFITTPESLNILLSSKSGRRVLEGISTVILDEIHAVVPGRRGTFLMTAVERMIPLCGEFQRIALSATVKPLKVVAEFVGGYRLVRTGEFYEYEKRPVKIVQSNTPKRYNINVRFPSQPANIKKKEDWWAALTEDFRDVIRGNQSTLFFTNSRRMVEKITRFINDKFENDRVYSHHGSLSREIRSVVEKRFKEGDLAAIVATSSLELGIDIGSVDQVVLVQPPFSIASAIQRIGRAGHGVGQVSSGLFYPLHNHAFLESAVIAAHIDGKEIEETMPLESPLDVLAQVVLSMTLLEDRDIDELFAEIRASFPYRHLGRNEFDLVMEMLAGRYADARIRELNPRLLLDRVKNTARARAHTAHLLYLSGGVIPDRGYYNLRVADSKVKIGQLDEEFVWERSLGEAFPFGNQIWRILRITHNDVEVAPVQKSNTVIPFWRAEDMNRSFHLSERIGGFLEAADQELELPQFKTRLLDLHHMSEAAADALIDYLKRQKKETGAPLPHRHHVLVEHFYDPVNVKDTKQTVLHTYWGGRVNRPFAFALAAAWHETYGYPLELFVNNDCIILNCPHAFGISEILALVKAEKVVPLLRKKLESTGFFGARFRENAQRALLLPRRSFHERMPLWLNRLRSKKLLEAVSQYEDFPVILETWRDCLKNEFEIERLQHLLEEIQAGEIQITEAATRKPSPFAEGIIWRQTNFYMYEDDTPGGKLQSNLSDQLLKEVMASSHLRPRFSNQLIDELQQKLQRTAEGYPPDSPEELLLWLKERLLIPMSDWKALMTAIQRDHEEDTNSWLKRIEDRISIFERDGRPIGMAALELEARIQSSLGSNFEEQALAAFLGEWLRFYGPVTAEFISSTLGIADDVLAETLDALAEDDRVLIDEFRESPADDQGPGPVEICEAENVEILLRMRRSRARPAFAALPPENLPLFLAAYQGLTTPGDTLEDLQRSIEMLFGYPARAALWESDIFPARLSPYYTHWLDAAVRQNELSWFGCGNERTSFCFESDFELFPVAMPASDREQVKEKGQADVTRGLDEVFAQSVGRLTFDDIAGIMRASTQDLSDGLWNLAWRGRIANDDYQTLRIGIMNRFKAESSNQGNASPGTRRRSRRFGFNRWKQSRPFTGSWYALEGIDSDAVDALDRQEIVKDRIRLLLSRYGVLMREIVWNELPGLRWGTIFPVLRLMELSGEIVSGHFFQGVAGLQFISPQALRLLNRGLNHEAVYWMNAADPASLCGIPIESLKGSLPRRLPTTHVVFQGATLVLVSKKNGKELEWFVEPGHPQCGEFLAFFYVLMSREFQPLKYINVETINGIPALDSPFRHDLLANGFQRDYKGLMLLKSY